MKYLIFDFDGVIGDTKDASAKATALVDGVDYNTALASNQYYAHNKPNHTRSHSLTEDQMLSIVSWTAQFGEHMKQSDFKLFEAFVHEIEQIDTKYKAVVSSGSQKYVVPAVHRTKIHPTHILAFEDHHSKEEKIETICKDWNVSVDEVYYFTDSLADIFELRDFIAPGKLIAVSWGYCSYNVLAKELDAQYILKTPKDINNIFSHA